MTDAQPSRVLLVDDDLAIRGFLSEALEDEGYEVRTAVNGRNALEVLDDWQPDLVLLDLMMPEMDGKAFHARVRQMERLENVPVVVMSASRTWEREAAALGVAAAFGKPFDLDTLLTSVRSLLDDPAAQDEPDKHVPPTPRTDDTAAGMSK
jgi:DNA-binding response OmpR family regulator